MAIPKQRGAGQTGGGMGHKHNTAASRARGGSPRAGGGGGKPPKKGGCPFAPEIWVIVLFTVVVSTATVSLVAQFLTS